MTGLGSIAALQKTCKPSFSAATKRSGISKTEFGLSPCLLYGRINSETAALVTGSAYCNPR